MQIVSCPSFQNNNAINFMSYLCQWEYLENTSFLRKEVQGQICSMGTLSQHKEHLGGNFKIFICRCLFAPKPPSVVVCLLEIGLWDYLCVSESDVKPLSLQGNTQLEYNQHAGIVSQWVGTTSAMGELSTLSSVLVADWGLQGRSLFILGHFVDLCNYDS